MAAGADLYTPPAAATSGGFLGRFRRPVYGPLAARYVSAWTEPGELVLDPFCQDAGVLRAAVEAGRRALAVTGNPLLALLVRVEAAPPAPEELRAALHRLQGAPKLEVPLGAHLDGLYATACSRCRAPVPADAFIWERGSAQPALRDYRCPHCRHSAREPVPPEEAAGHARHDGQGFHRRLIAERLRVEGAPPALGPRLLDLYTPRNTYALAALLLKIELLFDSGPLLDALRAAFLQTLDVASKLNQVTEEGWRPVRSLQPPRQFREANVWRAFAQAVEAVAGLPPGPRLLLAATPVEAAGAPLPGPVYVGQEPLSRLRQALAGQVALALAQLPRFDPAFAALSYLWSGWLLGKEGSRAAVRLLPQRAREEAPYRRALRSFLGAVGPTLSPEGRLAVVFQAPATRYLEELLLAAGAAGLPLVHAWHGALEDDPAPALGARRCEHHIVLGRPSPPSAPPGERLQRAEEVAVRTAAAVLEERAEPGPFTVLHGPIWAALARAGLLRPGEGDAEGLRRQLEEAVARGLHGAGHLLRPLPAPGGEEVTWWLAEPPPGGAPLADRVEEAVARALRRTAPLGELALWEELAARFPAPQAPAWPLVLACLEAYGEGSALGQWTLAPEEEPAAVEVWRARQREGLMALGPRLGYAVRAAPAGRQLPLAGGPADALPVAAVEWLEGDEVAYAFLLRTTTASAELRALPPPAAGRRVLVIPERRVRLWRHRLAATPPWATELKRAGCTFLRPKALERLQSEPPSRERLAAALGLAEAGDQLSLFGT